MSPVPAAARIAAPRTAVLSIAGIATGTPSTSALIRAQVSSWLGRPASRSSRSGAPASTSGSATWRSENAAASRTARASCARPCAERQADERAARPLVEDRRPLAGEVGQEHEAVRAGRDGGRGGRAARRRSSRRPSTARSQSTAAPVAAMAPPTTQRPGSGAGATNRPGDRRPRGPRRCRCRPTSRRCRPRRPRSEEPGPEHRRRAVVHAGDDRDPGRRPSAGPRPPAAPPSGVPNGSGSRGLGPADARRLERPGRQRGLVALERLGGLARQPQPERVPARQQPACLGGGIEVVVREPRDLRQQPPAAAADPPVLPGDRRPRRLARPRRGRRASGPGPRRRSRRRRPRPPPSASIDAGGGRDRAATSRVDPAPRGRRGRGTWGSPPGRGRRACRRGRRAPPSPRSCRGPAPGPPSLGAPGPRSLARAVGSPSREHVLGQQEPAQVVEVAGPRRPGRSPTARRAGAAAAARSVARLGEVARRGATRARGGGARVAHPAVVVADVVERQRRLGAAGAVAPQAASPARTGTGAAAASPRVATSSTASRMYWNTVSLMK